MPLENSGRALDAVTNILADQEAKAMKEIMQEEEEELEVTDGELVKLAHLLESLQFKYAQRAGTWENYKSLADEARDRAATEIGLDVYLDWMLPSMQSPPQPPVLRVNGRFTEYDHDKNVDEIRSGIADHIWAAKRKHQRH